MRHLIANSEFQGTNKVGKKKTTISRTYAFFAVKEKKTSCINSFGQKHKLEYLNLFLFNDCGVRNAMECTVLLLPLTLIHVKTIQKRLSQ